MPNRRHQQERTTLERADGKLLFRANCSCGWTSEPVTANHLIQEWDAHLDEIARLRQRADS